MSPSTRILVLAVAVFTVLHCARSPADAATVPTASTASAGDGELAPSEVVQYQGEWEYHWGDLAKDHGRTFYPFKMPGTPPGRAGNNFLWLRTRLNGPLITDTESRPALFLLVVDQIFEAYLDGRLIYRFGVLDGDGEEARRFIGYKAHFLPIGSDYQGKMLSLRIYSEHVNIGVYGDPYLGSHLALTLAAVRMGQDKLIVGVVLIALGLTVLILFALRPQERSYLDYGGFALCIGIYMVTQLPSRALLLDTPLLWVHIEMWSLYLIPAFLLRYLCGLLGQGPMRLTYRMMQLQWLYFFVSALLVIAGAVPLMATWLPFGLMTMFNLIYIAGMTTLAILQGNVEARIYGAGLFIATAIFFYDMLAAMAILPRRTMTNSHIGAAIFVVSLGIVPARRLVLMAKNVAAYSRDLSDKLKELETKSAKIRSLNDELMRQIEQRSRRLLEALLKQQDAEEDPTLLPGPVVPLAKNALLGEAYRVVRVIGQGGFGVVYEVERITDGQRLAAKLLHRSANRNALVRFAREAQLLSRFNHPNLVGISDVDVTADGAVFIIMELVQGASLRELRPRYGDLNFALPVLSQIAEALSAVHERGIVHRDLKPANVLVTEQSDGPDKMPLVKLADFGISVLARTESAGVASGDLTGTGMLVGTPKYMAPELHVGSRLAQASSDIFSLGIIAYELIMSELPYQQPAIQAMLQSSTLRMTADMRQRTDLAPELAQLFERCLSIDPATRPTAQEIAQALIAHRPRRDADKSYAAAAE